MSLNDEDQVRAMLEAMGVGAATESEPPPAVTKPAAPAPSTAANTAPTMSLNEALSSIEGITERPQNAPAVASSAVHSREMTLSTLVHLLGLSTSSQVGLLETQIDSLATKLSTILLKLDRLTSDIGAIKSDAAVDRIDFQITEIRALLKRVVPAAAGAGEIETKSDPTKSASGRAKILTSDASKATPKKPETKIVEQDQLEEFNKPDDATFQAEEAKRIRNQPK